MLTLDKIEVPTETPLFNERKATEAAVAFIGTIGDRANLVRVLAMMYLADRRLIAEFGRGLTDDSYLALAGVVAVPSDLLHHAFAPFSSTWHRHIENSRSQWFRVTHEFEPSALSAKERDVVKIVSEAYGVLSEKRFIEAFRREAPEVQEIGTGPFTLEGVLIAVGEDPEVAAESYSVWDSLRHIRAGKAKKNGVTDLAHHAG